MGFIYEQKDESKRVENLDKFMTGLFKLVLTCSFGVIAILVYRHIA